MPDEDPQSAPHRALVGLLLIILLVVGVLFVMFRLHASSQMQDCLASGRTNCAPFETQHR